MGNLAPNEGSSAMGSPKILYRNSRLLRMVFLQLHRQQRADLFCDVVLQAEGEAVPAHCCILSACSPFFTERLEREMPPKGHKVVLELRGLKIGPLRKLVDFLYTSEMEVSREEAQDVLAAARQLQVSELESLQLEGGKLVKKGLGRRLNRECLQLSSPVSIREGSLMHSPPSSDVCCLTSHLLARKQQAAVHLPGTNGVGNSQKETDKEKPAIKSEETIKIKDTSAMAEFLTAKVKKRLAGTVKNMMGSEETGHLPLEQGRPRVKQAEDGLQESKKIKLSRPKLSSPLPVPSTTKDHDVIVSSKISKSIRRLWRKKSPPMKDHAKGAEVPSHLYGFLSPSVLLKPTKGRKRSSSEPALSVNPPQEAGQVGRVKLRKVINGSCWEVVQEPSAALSMRAADSVCALKEESSPPQRRYTEQEVAAPLQQLSSTELLPVKAESSSFTEKTLVGESGSPVPLVDGESYQLLMLDELVEGKRYDSLASAGELEHMLDLLLADDESVGESQDPTVPEGVSTSGLAPKASNIPLENAGAEDKLLCSAEVSVCPQWIKDEQSSLQGEEGCAASKISEGTPGLTNGVPFLDPVHSCLSLATLPSSHDCISLCSLTSTQQENLTTHHQLGVLENGATRLTAPLSSHKNQGLPSYGEATSGAETKPQALLKSPLQHHLDCKLPLQLVLLEEDEIDVGEVEFFLNNESVWPDSSPMSENEVDVVN
ncbi:BTB/POZ domain-containing protein 18 isoform X3 [Paroedura picta]|uniref:BTB/POZ domain-containing protein 18 isoform X3 n=1 Tax=Paroedura picta TaxID=143630 RepID=UPI004056AB2B